jgi:epsilon-lactone hydrolase
VPQLRANLFDRIIRRIHVFGDDGAGLATLRARFERLSPIVWPWLGIRTSPAQPGGVPAEWVTTSASATDRVLLYLHGGGWFMGSPRTHRSMIATLVRATGFRGLSLDYRLAPEHPYPAALDDCVAAYEWLLGSAIAPDRIIVAGDSAGANLALALLLRLRDSGRPLPAAAVLLSPMTDLTLSGESHATRRALDPYFAHADLRSIIDWYAPQGLELGPYLSPAQADLHGLPPLLIHVGDHEVLHDDAVSLGERALAAGVDARTVVWPGMMHVFHVFAPYLPDARRAHREIADFIGARIA